MQASSEPRSNRHAYEHALAEAGVDDAWMSTLMASDLAVDLEPSGFDVTSWAFVPESARGRASMRARTSGILAGASLLPAGLEAFDDLELELKLDDGAELQPKQSAATLSGSLRQLLSFERTALNLVTHLSGIATETSAYVAEVAGTKACICDTRKTLPGLRRLQKYAVRCGGGTAHRDSLGDAMLVKDNHLAGVPEDQIAATLEEAATAARARFPELKFVEVEVDTLNQLRRFLATSVDIVLLDNMPLDWLSQAVAMRDAANPRVLLEASGGVNLTTVRGIAQTGVDRISVGALTHSAPSLDLGLDMDRWE